MAGSERMRHSGLMLGLLAAEFGFGCGAPGGSMSLPPPPSLKSSAVTPSMPTIVAGTSQSFTATGAYGDNSQKDVTAQATCISATTSVASVGSAADPQPVKGLAAGTSSYSRYGFWKYAPYSD